MQTGRNATHTIRKVAGSIAIVGLLLGLGVLPASARAHPLGKPKYGGSYSIWLSNPPDCLDPQMTAAAASNQIDSYVLDPLISIDPKGNYAGDLATKWKASNHGTTVTFTLRQGVKFSNGDALTAKDVQFTFDRALNPATKSPLTASLLSDVSATRVVSKYVVALDLKTTQRTLFTNLASAYTGILDPKAIAAEGSNTCQNPVGTGPYKVTSTGSGFSDVTLSANKYRNFAPDWFLNHRKPYVNSVQFVTIANEDTAISDLLQGSLSIASIPGDQYSRVKGNANIKLHNLPAQNLIFTEFNTAHAPFNKAPVRRAVAAMINRDAIVRAALLGQGRAVYGPLSPAIPLFDKAAAKYMPKYSISAAKKVVKKYHATGPYNLIILPVAPFTTIAELIQSAASQAGMKINIVDEGSVGAWVAAASSGNFDLAMLEYSYNDPDVMYLFLDSSQEKGGLNFSRYHDAKLDSLLTLGRTTLNAKKAASVYAQAQVRVNQDAFFIGMASSSSILGTRSNIKGFHVNREGAWAPSDLYLG